MLRATTILIAALLGLTACEFERPPTWSYLHAAVIRPNCATAACHANENAESPVVFGVALESRELAYETLTGQPCGSGNMPGVYVLPATPSLSPLIALLEGRAGIERPMPPDRELPEVDIDLIEAWIAAGAPCD